jgi:aquaporin Z
MNFTNIALEFLGTFLLISVILLVGYSAAVGATLAGIVYFLSSTSGGHVNPAVSLAVYLKGDMDGASFLSYVVAQLLGGLVAFYASRAVRPLNIKIRQGA